MQWSEECNSPPINLKPNPLKGIKSFSPTTHDRGKGETKTTKLQKLQQGYKLRFEAKEIIRFHDAIYFKVGGTWNLYFALIET
jgi:hypothetical protein